MIFPSEIRGYQIDYSQAKGVILKMRVSKLRSGVNCQGGLKQEDVQQMQAKERLDVHSFLQTECRFMQSHICYNTPCNHHDSLQYRIMLYTSGSARSPFVFLNTAPYFISAAVSATFTLSQLKLSTIHVWSEMTNLHYYITL
jgi:hypothetical protein